MDNLIVLCPYWSNFCWNNLYVVVAFSSKSCHNPNCSKIFFSTILAKQSIWPRFYLSNFGKAFISKLSDSESEAAETQVWLEFAVKCGYMKRDQAAALYQTYDGIIGTIVGMITHPETWVIGMTSDKVTN